MLIITIAQQQQLVQPMKYYTTHMRGTKNAFPIKISSSLVKVEHDINIYIYYIIINKNVTAGTKQQIISGTAEQMIPVAEQQ